MTREVANYDLAAVLLRRGIPPQAILLGDAFYALPLESWVTGSFAQVLAGAFAKLDLRYETERQDCENFAQLAAWFASYCHARTETAPESGLAFGEVWIARLAHAINLAVHQDDQGLLYVQGYEPQLDERGFSCRPFPLSPEDFKSVTLCKI